MVQYNIYSETSCRDFLKLNFPNYHDINYRQLYKNLDTIYIQNAYSYLDIWGDRKCLAVYTKPISITQINSYILILYEQS